MTYAYTRVRKFLKPVVSCDFVNERRLNGMLEKDIERKLQRKVKAAGGVCLKFISPGNSGVPDRLILFDRGRIAFAELKRPGEKPRPLQLVQIRKLRDLGFRVYVISSEEEIAELVKEQGNA